MVEQSIGVGETGVRLCVIGIFNDDPLEKVGGLSQAVFRTLIQVIAALEI